MNGEGNPMTTKKAWAVMGLALLLSGCRTTRYIYYCRGYNDALNSLKENDKRENRYYLWEKVYRDIHKNIDSGWWKTKRYGVDY
jgi:hypothetical protein